MKTLKKLLFLFVGLGLLTACEKNNWGDDAPGNTLNKGPKHSVLVTVPVKAEFSVVPESGVPDDTYPEYALKLTMVGEGTMSHLGKMTTRIVFWVEAGMSPVGPYGYGTGSFVAANGDELHFVINDGLIIWNEMDNADFYLTRFNDEILVTGGTGRFEGASGCIMSNAFVHYPADESDYWHTDFFSYGSLILVKGKK